MKDEDAVMVSYPKSGKKTRKEFFRRKSRAAFLTH